MNFPQTNHGKFSISLFLVIFFCVLPRLDAAPGDLDRSFGDQAGGAVTTMFRDPTNPNFYCNAKAYASVVQPDDKIVAVGSLYNRSNNYDIALARYNADGTLDTTFGSGGRVTARVNATSNEEAFAVRVQPDGKIVVAGYAVVTYAYSGSRRFFAVFRFNENGTLDYSFGNSGKALTEVAYPGYQQSGAVARALVIQPDEKIVAVGHAVCASGFGFGHALARYDSNGSLDTSFGSGGRMCGIIGSNYTSYAFAAGQQSDSEIVTGGRGLYDPSYRKYDFSAVRFNPNAGTVDSVTMTNFYNDDADETAFGVAVQDDDKFVLVGNTASNAGSYSDYAVARYNADGTPDDDFGYDGKTRLDFGVHGVDVAHAVALQADGKIIAAGYSVINSSNDFSLARFNEDGSVDVDFGNLGKVTTSYGSSSEIFYSVNTQSDGKIVAVGTANVVFHSFALARYEN